MAAPVPDAPSEAAGSAWGSGSMSSKGSPHASGSKVGSRHRTPHSSPSHAPRCKPAHPLGKPRTRGSASQPRPTPPRRLSAPRGLSSRARPFARVESSAAHIANSAPPSGPLAPGAPWPQPPKRLPWPRSEPRSTSRKTSKQDNHGTQWGRGRIVEIHRNRVIPPLTSGSPGGPDTTPYHGPRQGSAPHPLLAHPPGVKKPKEGRTQANLEEWRAWQMWSPSGQQSQALEQQSQELGRKNQALDYPP
nr:hypothetical protein Itr_chr04CG09330 [Ipomoea trifida]